MKINRTYLRFIFVFCTLVALFLISQNWKNQLVIKDVQIYDESILTSGEVRTLADVPTGSPLYGISLASVSERVEQNPFVKRAVVVRALPYDLTITLHERTPIALIALPSEILSIDADGFVLPLPMERKADMPVITGASANLGVGDTAKGELEDAVKFLADAKNLGRGLTAGIAEVQLGTNGLVAFTTASSLPVVIGKGDFERKLLYLQKFLTEVAATDPDCDYVDLRFAGQIVLGDQSVTDAFGSPSSRRGIGKVN